MRILFDAHFMSAVSSWDDARPTFFGNTGSQSLIDHIFMPTSMLDAARSAGPLMGMSKRLQLINKRGPADHASVHVHFWYLRAHISAPPPSSVQALVSPEVAGVRWDMDKLMLGVREGQSRRDFIAEMEITMTEFAQTHDHLLQENTPDKYFTALDTAMILCAQRFFGKTAKEDDPEYAAMAAERLELLRKRRELKANMVDSPDDGTFDNLAEKLIL